jgi:hypothetical protein
VRWTRLSQYSRRFLKNKKAEYSIVENKTLFSRRKTRQTWVFSLAMFGVLLMSIFFLLPGEKAQAATLATQVRSVATSSYTLTINDPGNLLSPTLDSELQGVFNYSYPLLVQRFGSSSTETQVTLNVYSANDGSVAYTSNGAVNINAVYQNANLDDLGWLTHELTHVVQNYQGGNVPGWFTEGMADYSRYYYAPAGANPSWWQIPGSPTSSDSYSEGYGVAARFLIWLQQQKSSTIVNQLNRAAQAQQDFFALFQQITGETVDQAWAQYTSQPGIAERGSCGTGFQVSYVPTQWTTGFTANLTIQNTGSTAVNGWTLVFTFPGTQQLTQWWNGTFSQQGETVTATNTGVIPAGQAVYPGFNASWSGTNANPTGFTLNGQSCALIYS